MKKCQCKSAPHYHREDCPIYDVYGNLKVEKKKTNFFQDDILNLIDSKIGSPNFIGIQVEEKEMCKRVQFKISLAVRQVFGGLENIANNVINGYFINYFIHSCLQSFDQYYIKHKIQNINSNKDFHFKNHCFSN
jgi:hypothetical protein